MSDLNDFNVIVYHDLTDLKDVVLINTDTLIARGENDNWVLDIRVVGDVIISWNAPDYEDCETDLCLYASEFPDSLTEYIKNNPDWDKTIPGKIEVISKNRFEFSISEKRGVEVEKVAVSEEDFCGYSADRLKSWLLTKYVRIIEQISDSKMRSKEVKERLKNNPDIFI